MKQMIDRLCRRLGYVKPQSYRFYIKPPKEGADWIQIIMSSSLIKGKLYQNIDAQVEGDSLKKTLLLENNNKRVEKEKCTFNELSIYENTFIKLEKSPDIDRSTEKNITHWFRFD